MDTPEYKVVALSSDDLEKELYTLAKAGWRPILISPASFGGASFVNSGPSRVSNFCVILERN